MMSIAVYVSLTDYTMTKTSVKLVKDRGELLSPKHRIIFPFVVNQVSKAMARFG